MTPDPRKIADTLTQTEQPVKELKKKGKPLELQPEELLDYTFKRGEEGYDRVRKQRVKILAGARGNYVKESESTG